MCAPCARQPGKQAGRRGQPNGRTQADAKSYTQSRRRLAARRAFLQPKIQESVQAAAVFLRSSASFTGLARCKQSILTIYICRPRAGAEPPVDCSCAGPWPLAGRHWPGVQDRPRLPPISTSPSVPVDRPANPRAGVGNTAMSFCIPSLPFPIHASPPPSSGPFACYVRLLVASRCPPAPVTPAGDLAVSPMRS
ncbi:hypothetical protein BDY21DRAFT_91095 [Lineolata rhizophorae]|uniref:Uncharacterized protein n=1 Tax=Lineolata rhizophorae TaxID=578093 RepID=A0A6A6PCE1_9PEZI|nr:hypothetical protein BDY21DRAFT_91095 [Lineolata rhizophorae]